MKQCKECDHHAVCVLQMLPSEADVCLYFNKKSKLKCGKWEKDKTYGGFRCSKCRKGLVFEFFDYCPWCGAEMKRGDDK